jgi:hypothetical protein
MVIKSCPEGHSFCLREKCKFYYIKGKRCMKKYQIWTEKNKERKKKNARDWYKRNREYARARDWNWEQKNKERIKKYESKRRKRLLKIAQEKVGKRCSICDGTKRVCFHEIYGKDHNHNLEYIIAHSEDFVSLCNYCHSGFIHYAHRHNVDMEKAVKLVNLLRAS